MRRVCKPHKIRSASKPVYHLSTILLERFPVGSSPRESQAHRAWRERLKAQCESSCPSNGLDHLLPQSHDPILAQQSPRKGAVHYSSLRRKLPYHVCRDYFWHLPNLED